jgi:hypothetical protein
MPNNVLITDVVAVQRELNKIDSGLKKALVRDIKEVAKPVQSAVKSAIPVVAPLSGLNNRGRLGWTPDKGKKPNDVRIVYRSGSRRNAGIITSLVSVNVGSAAVTMIDIAGKRNPNGRDPRGAALIRNLGKQPSRYAWPAAETALPAVEGKIEHIVAEYCKQFNIRA